MATRPAERFRSRSRSATVAPCGASRRSPLTVIVWDASILLILPYGLVFVAELVCARRAPRRLEHAGGRAIGNARWLSLSRVWLRSTRRRSNRSGAACRRRDELLLL